MRRKLMRGLGLGINEFKKGVKEGTPEDGDKPKDPPLPPPH